MSRAKSGLKQASEYKELTEPRRPTSAALSNSFNPPLSNQSKSPLPAINSQRNTIFNPPVSLPVSKDVSTKISFTSEEADPALAIGVFKAKKTSVNDLSQAACSYLWFRRIKEIFLIMGKQNDAFSRFDMELARTDMIQACQQYLESERPKGGGIHLVCINE